jgi:hypothetical protein
VIVIQLVKFAAIIWAWLDILDEHGVSLDLGGGTMFDRRLTIGATAPVALVLAAALQSTGAGAQSSGIEGTWRGGGTVEINGNSEKARCNVSYSKKGGASYTAFANCATASGRVAQSASLTRTGANTYEGSFYNNEYGVSGSISITVRGNKQSVYLSSAGGSASLSLSR